MSPDPGGVERDGGNQPRSPHTWIPAALGMVLATVAAAPAVLTPAMMRVPAGLLRQNTGIEASGVVWAAALDRYLVVSDDTGTEDDKHQPWLFAMSRDGTLDPSPIPIRGLETMNDAEAICAGPDGTFFLTTSHSLNKKGKAKAERRMLLELRLSGRVLSVEGRLDLTTATDAQGRGLLAIAGLDPSGSLDIEGLAYAGGALLVGLKSPLTSRGDAVILRLERPLDAFRTGRIAPGTLSRLRAASLPVARAGGGVHRGISDLVGLPDGSFVLLGNAPKGAPPDDGGAMYWLRPGATTATLLREFPGLKPEGVTLAEDGRELVVVFDTDREPPRWTRAPLPH
jgi:phytase-like protein